MIPNRRNRVALGVLLLSMLALSLPARFNNEALARGVSHGLHWGYQPPSGNPLSSIWAMTNFWSQMSGGAIPHHSLGPADLNMASSPGNRYTRSSDGMSMNRGSYGSFGGGGSYGATNRRTMFPGSSSQMTLTSTYRPSSGYTPVYYSAPTNGTDQHTQSHFEPAYYHSYNEYWHHGFWGGGLAGWSHWDPELGIWSFPRWGLGPLYFDSGYGTYRNPFASADNSVARYASLLDLNDESGSDSAGAKSESPRSPVTPSPDQLESRVLKSPEVTAGLKAFDEARAAFRKHDFDAALRKVDEALESLPNDPALHEFRGLVLFARGDYRQAAAVIYAVLAVSPGWDWTTLSGLYADQQEYTEQLRKLETYRKQNTQAPEAAFLVAYHYATCGHHDIAAKHLHNVTKLLPDDNLVPHLATLFAVAGAKNASNPSSDVADAETSKVAASPPEQKSNEKTSTEFDGSKLVGTWTASRGADMQIELTLMQDATFMWVYERGGKRQTLEGNYLWSGNRLILSSDEGTMIGVVAQQSLAGGFQFRLLENAPDERGLEFAK